MIGKILRDWTDAAAWSENEAAISEAERMQRKRDQSLDEGMVPPDALSSNQWIWKEMPYTGSNPVEGYFSRL